MSQFQGMKPLRSIVYLFTCGSPDFKGFSLHQDGANLPTLCGARRSAAGVSSEQSQCRRLIFDPSLETWGCARELEDPQLPHRAQQGRGETDHQNSTTGLASAEIINAIQMISGRFCWGSRGFSGFLYWSWPKTMPPRRSWPRQRKRPPPLQRP
jgi:hypothetical protein